MGFNVVNAVVFGKDPQTIFHEASLTPSRQFVDFPDDDPVCGARLPSGAYGLYLNDPVLSDRILHTLSLGGSVFRLEVSETVMHSSLTALVDGQENWSVWHEGGFKGTDHIETTGGLPDCYESIFAKQNSLIGTDDQVDFFFDVAVNLFVALGGFRYDEDLPVDDPQPWEVLHFHPPKQGWFSRIFGSR